MARSYTGSGSNYITSTTSIGLGSPLTVSCWFNNADTTTDQALVVVAQDASFYNQLLYDGSNSYGLGDNKVVFDGSSATAATSTTVGATGGWHHAAGSRDGTTAGSVYLDGGGKGTSAVGIANAAIGIVDIGVFRAGGGTSFSPANAQIAEVGIWNVQLTDDEILSLAKGVSPQLIRPISLVFYAPLWGRGDLVDLATQRALTITGTVPAGTSHAPVLYSRKARIAQPTAAGGGTTYTLTAAQGSYTVTGQTTNLLFKGSLTSAFGTYAVTGQDVQFQSGKTVAANGGTYAVTGFDAGTIYSGDVSQLGAIIEPIPEEEAYVFPGLNLFNIGPFDNPPAGSAVTADYTTYAVTGFDANLVYFNKNLTGDTGLYTVTGNTAGMVYSGGTNRTVTADFGVYSVVGQPVNLIFVGFDPGTTGQTVLSNHKSGGGGSMPAGKSISYRRFEQINEKVASEKEAKAAAERDKAEKIKEAQAAKKAAAAAQAKANIPAGDREIEDVTADMLIAKLTASVKDIVRNTISEELDDLHASMGALLEHASGGEPEPAQPEYDPMVAPWKK